MTHTPLPLLLLRLSSWASEALGGRPRSRGRFFGPRWPSSLTHARARVYMGRPGRMPGSDLMNDYV
jgi:hypothetical protein